MAKKSGKKTDALFEQAKKLYNANNYAGAMKQVNRILSISPRFALARLMRASILLEEGYGDEALAESTRALADQPGPDARSYYNHSIVCKRTRHFDEAIEACEKAIDLAPGDLDYKDFLASIYFEASMLAEAEKLLLELAEETQKCSYFLNLARISIIRGDNEKGGEYLARAEALDPDHPALGPLKARLALVGDDVQKSFELAVSGLRKKVTQVEGWTVLRATPTENFEVDEIAFLMRALLESWTSNSNILSIAAALARHTLVWDDLPALETTLRKALDNDIVNNVNLSFNASAMFDLLGCHVSQKAHKIAAETIWKSLYGKVKIENIKMSPFEEKRRLKVGFISSDFRDHAISQLIVGVIEKLPREKIEWFAYSVYPSDKSYIRWRVARAFDHFNDVENLDDAQLKARIREDNIDILVDLNGMTKNNRCDAIASKAAPIHVQWIGMPGSLGAEGVADYVLGDKWASPAWLAEGFTEKIIQLPRSYFPSDHKMPDYTLAGERHDHGLPQNAFVFCCFNQYYKFSPETIAMWGEIMRAVPDSVLWLLKPETEGIKNRLYGIMEKEGIASERIVFAPKIANQRHIARIGHADLILDTLPYNAHTTTIDALRAGAPVLTLPGETFAGRVAASILDTGGLNEWIVDSPEAYVKKAIDYALLDPDEREEIRENVYDRYIKSPMLDNEAFGRVLEDLFIGLAKREEAGLAPVAMRLTEEGDLVPIVEGAEEGETPKPAWMN